MMAGRALWQRLLPVIVFVGVFAGHALYLRHQGGTPAAGWADIGGSDDGLWGFAPYVDGQDYHLGFSYGLGSAFTAWAALAFLRVREAAVAAGAAGGVTLVGALMAAGCFMVGCCGSPMLGVYAGIFGAKALGVGKPLMTLVTLVSVAGGYWYLSRRISTRCCCGKSCACDDDQGG